MSTVNINREALTSFLTGVKDYVGITKEAKSVSDSRVEEAVYSLCESGLIPIQKRAEVIDGILQNPNRICDLLEKLASRVGPSSLGGGDAETVSGDDPELSFIDFCVN